MVCVGYITRSWHAMQALVMPYSSTARCVKASVLTIAVTMADQSSLRQILAAQGREYCSAVIHSSYAILKEKLENKIIINVYCYRIHNCGYRDMEGLAALVTTVMCDCVVEGRGG